MKTDAILIVKMDIAWEVNCIRTDNEAALNEVLSGKKIGEVSKGIVLVFETLPPPNGDPLSEDDLGCPAITTVEEASNVAKAALQNPNSIPRKKDFSVVTPIYLCRENAQAEKLQP